MLERSKEIVGLHLEVRTDFRWTFNQDAWFLPAEPQPDLIIIPYQILGEEKFIQPPVPYMGHGPAEGLRLTFLMGALDYLREPWTEDELFLRLERYLPPVRTLSFPQGLVRFNRERQVLEHRGQGASLSPAEARVLDLLTREPGTLVSREEIIKCIGKLPDQEGSRVTDVIISRLRKKLLILLGKPEQSNPIVSRRSEGYLLPTYGAYDKLSP